MIKVVHLISGDLWAGAENMASLLLKGLKKFPDLSLSAMVLNPGKLADALQNNGIPVEIYDESKISAINIYRSIKKKMKAEKPDIIHAHRYKENVISALLARSFTATRLVTTQHGMPEMFNGSTSRKHFYVNKLNFFILNRYFDRVVSVSQDIEDAFIQLYHFPAEKISRIYNGIEFQKVTGRKDFGKKLTIGSAGRFFPVKDYLLLVEVANYLINELHRSDIRFKLAGDGPDREKIEQKIDTYGLRNVFDLVGFIDDTGRFYEELDIYMNTSRHEGIPLSVLEAMAAGLPVIAPDVGGLKEIVENGENGYLISQRSSRRFGDACLKLCRDKKLYREMSRTAIDTIKRKFSLEKMSRKYYSLYCHLKEKREITQS